MAFSQNEKTINNDSILSSIGKNNISESDFEKYESTIKSIYLENKTTAEIYITTLLKTAEKQKNDALMARSHYLLGEHFYKDKKEKWDSSLSKDPANRIIPTDEMHVCGYGYPVGCPTSIPIVHLFRSVDIQAFS